MSLDIESRLKVYLASAPRAIRAIPTLELSHSAMSRTYYLWREPYIGSITDEDDNVRTVEPVNLDIKLAGVTGTLDQQYQIPIDTTDIEDEFREEMDLIPLGTQEKIRCVYREYLSDDLTSVMARAPLQVEAISYRVGAATLTAVSPRLNISSTGERYVPRDVPMLRAFL